MAPPNTVSQFFLSFQATMAELQEYISSLKVSFFFLQTHSVETPYGSVTFTVYGTPKPKRPAIFTYHDVGLNYKSCFQPLFQFGDMQEIIQNFVRVHVDAPGMEEGAPVFPLGYQYPSLDQLADMIPCILQYLK
ncbi:protein NDRG2-like [Rattus rattus]|uniref:protein NDRG2-like n=1 Tax=Rattus rattus TaxID=10117 RepID=UPI0013F322CC|nr:protein NDRG2-like [Rattus rattus]